MRSEVKVLIDESQEFTFELDGLEPMAPDVARWWLDDQFTQMGGEPLRATGKLLLADKVLVVAQAGGAKLLADPKWGNDFARAAHTALGKPVITVDLSTMSVSY